MASMDLPCITDFYAGRSVLVTGGTGFMGKVLVEKLLRSCPDIGTVFLLMRAKRGQSPAARVEGMLKLPLFERMRRERPEAQHKLQPVLGDVTLDGLGLSEAERRRLCDHVSVVFHCAATLRLDAKLKDAINMNLTGTWRILELCKDFSKLKAFVHLSTAFCHCDKEVLEEKGYPASYDPHDIMRCVRWMDDKSLELITPRLMEPHPNSYTFSKRLAEALVEEYYPQLPVCIARPSIVTPSMCDPIPGWVDNLHGPMGLLVGGGKGVIRSMHCADNAHSEVIPVDYAICGLIRIACRVGSSKERPEEMPVYNVTGSSVYRPTWTQVLETGRKYVHEYPFEMTVWYPDGGIRTSKFMHNMCVIFLHFLPAYFIDFLMLIFMQKRFMVNIQRKIQDGLEVLQHFTSRDWCFRSDKFMRVLSEEVEKDKEEFFVDYNNVDIEEYFKYTVLGCRHYCMKEDPASLPRCRRHLKVLYVIDKLWSVIFYSLLIWLVLSCSETARYMLDFVIDWIKVIPTLRSRE